MKIINIKSLFLVCFLLTFFNIITFGQVKDRIGKVVIDAGHGGTMPGAIGKLCKEKDINLNVALRLGKLISENLKDVSVIYTRKGDETVELFKRTEMANKSKADLFISIHCNSVEKKNVQANGVETFVMGVDKSEASIAIAKKENADMLLEKDYKTNYSDFDPNSPEAYIVFSLYSSAYLNSSTLLASKVQKHLVTNSKLADRKVKQAGLWVLYKVAMPSILIELGFISNPEEEEFLIREETQDLLATSIYNAFVEYKNLLEETSIPYLPVPKIPKLKLKMETPADITPTNTVEVPKTTNIDTADTTIQISDNKPVEVRFRIQFFTGTENLKTTDKKFSALSEVNKFNENNVWKYTTGNYKTLTEAQTALKEVKKIYGDAFIIAFRNEQKITVQEAQKLLE